MAMHTLLIDNIGRIDTEMTEAAKAMVALKQQTQLALTIVTQLALMRGAQLARR